MARVRVVRQGAGCRAQTVTRCQGADDLTADRAAGEAGEEIPLDGPPLDGPPLMVSPHTPFPIIPPL